MKYKLRKAQLSDLEKLIDLFIEIITTINAEDYRPDQIQAWTISSDRDQRWKSKIEEQYFILAELDDKIIGFSSITADGYLTCFLSIKIFRGEVLLNIYLMNFMILLAEITLII